MLAPGSTFTYWSHNCQLAFGVKDLFSNNWTKVIDQCLANYGGSAQNHKVLPRTSPIGGDMASSKIFANMGTKGK